MMTDNFFQPIKLHEDKFYSRSMQGAEVNLQQFQTTSKYFAGVCMRILLKSMASE